MVVLDKKLILISILVLKLILILILISRNILIQKQGHFGASWGPVGSQNGIQSGPGASKMSSKMGYAK